jgi:hypothetical protein
VPASLFLFRLMLTVAVIGFMVLASLWIGNDWGISANMVLTFYGFLGACAALFGLQIICHIWEPWQGPHGPF